MKAKQNQFLSVRPLLYSMEHQIWKLKRYSFYMLSYDEKKEDQSKLQTQKYLEDIRADNLKRQKDQKIWSLKPKYQLPKMIEEILEMELEELPKNWEIALSEVKVNDKITEYLPSCVKTCGGCGQHLLKGGQVCFVCNICLGYFHKTCKHTFKCDIAYESWRLSNYPIEGGIKIDVVGFQMIKKPMFNNTKVTFAQQNLYKILNEDNERIMKERGTPTRKNIYYQGYKFYPNMNGNLKVLNKKDQEILERWENSEYHPPAKICEIEGKGKGVLAFADIKQGTLICTYSGEVIPMSLPHSSEYFMMLSYGPHSSSEFGIRPDKFWSLGNYLNHTNKKEQENVSSLRILTQKGIVIVMFAKKKIQAGKQLVYNYNSYEQNYNTDDMI